MGTRPYTIAVFNKEGKMQTILDTVRCAYEEVESRCQRRNSQFAEQCQFTDGYYDTVAEYNNNKRA